MPPPASASAASLALNCYSCNRSYSRSQYVAAFNENGHEVCPECDSEFVELVEQTSSSRPLEGNDAASRQSAAQTGASGNAGGRQGGVGTNMNTARPAPPRIEFRAMFHPRASDTADVPLTFVDAISRFAPLSLPNGQQAFVLQVQDGVLLSPFTMGIPFGDAIALNPADWVVGDDLDAVVTRVLDAYMPPRRATAPETLDALPRRRVRPGPLSPRPTATLEAAAKAASAASFSLRPATAHGSILDERVGEETYPTVGDADANTGSQVAGKEAGQAAREPVAVTVHLEPSEAGADAGGGGGGNVRLRLEYMPRVAVSGTIGGSVGPGDGTRAERSAFAAQHPGGAAHAAAATPAPVPKAAAATAATAASAGEGFASCQPGELCTVCHDAFEPNGLVVELPCHHCFHEDCILPWLQEQNTCPVCRMRLREGTGISSGGQGQQRQQQQQPSEHNRHHHEGGVSSLRAAGRAGVATSERPLTGEQPAEPAASAAGAAAASAPAAQPPQHQQQQRPGSTAGVQHFPLLGALRQQPVGLGPGPSVLTIEQRHAAEAALAPLRTRFTPLQLSSASAPAAGGSPGTGLPRFGGPTMIPLFGGTATHPTRGSGPRTQPSSGAQQGYGLGGATALRGGFFNNPLLNLYDGPSGGPSSAPSQAGGASSTTGGTRSALRGGFFNSTGVAATAAAGTAPGGGSGGAAAAAVQRARTAGGAAGLGGAGTLPHRPQRPQPNNTTTTSSRSSAVSSSLTGGSSRPRGEFGEASTGAPGAMQRRREATARMIWSVSIAEAAERAGILSSSPYTTSVRPEGPAGSRPETSPAPSGAIAGSTAPAAAAAASAGAGGALASPGAPSRDDQPRTVNLLVAMSNPEMGSEAVLQALAASLPRLDRSGRGRPSEEDLTRMQRQALTVATRMAHTLLAPGMSPHELMSNVAAVAGRWLARAVTIVQRVPRAAPTESAVERSAASDAATAAAAAGAIRARSSPAGTAAAAAATASGPAAVGTAASGSRVRGSSGSGSGGNGNGGASDEDAPTRQVPRRTQLQDAATLAHQHSSKDTHEAEPGGGIAQDSTDVSAGGSGAAAPAVPGAEQPGASGEAAGAPVRSGDGGSATEVGGAGRNGPETDGAGGQGGDRGRATASTSGDGAARMRPARKGRVVASVRTTAPRASAASAAGAAPSPAPTVQGSAAGARRRSASLPRAGGNSDGSSGRSGGGGAAHAVVTSAAGTGGPRQGTGGGGNGGGGGGAGGGGGGFNPLAAVVGGAGAGLRFIGGAAAGLFRRGRGNAGGDGIRRQEASSSSSGDRATAAADTAKPPQ